MITRSELGSGHRRLDGRSSEPKGCAGLSRERPVSGGAQAWRRAVCCLTLAAIVAASGSLAAAMQVAKGVTYENDRISDGPWSIHIVKISRTNAELELHTTLANGTIHGLSILSEQVKSVPAELGRPLAAINGDFFRYERTPYNGDPRGLQIRQGELVSAPGSGVCVWVDAQGNPHLTNVLSQLSVTWPNGEVTSLGLNEERRGFAAVLFTPTIGSSTFSVGGRELVLEHDTNGPWLPLRVEEVYSARVREVRETGNTPMSQDIMVLSLDPARLANVPLVEPGAVLKISTATSPDLKGARAAIGGGPALVRDGKSVAARRPPPGAGQASYDQRSKYERHPRSAFGWNKSHFFLVEVDGRQPGLSIGMNLAELADYFVKLGCEEAMALDGGGSATLWVSGRVMNNPCDGHERAMANALVVVRKEKPAGH